MFDGKWFLSYSIVEMSANYGVISWTMQGGDPLNPEELEVFNLSKLIIKNATIPRPGVTVMFQFKQTLWEGSILSVHGMIKILFLLQPL